MKAFAALFLLALALVLGGTLAQPIVERWEDKNAYQRTLETIQAEDFRYQLESTAVSRSLVSNAAGPLALIVGLVAVLIVIDMYRQRRDPIVRVDGVPLARQLVTSKESGPALLALAGDKTHATSIAQIEQARQPGPIAHSLTYAPRITAPAQLPGATELLQLAAPASIPTFSQLLDEGKIGPDADGRNQPLLLGYNVETGEPIEGSWKSLYSAGIGALQGAGKSWLEAFLLGQSALQGARLIICDPHGGHDSESLASRIAPLAPAFLCNVAQSDREILAALKLANDELDRRKAGKGSSYPIVIAIDEWTSLLRGELGDLLPAYTTNFAEQGRKFGVNALLSAQGWSKDAAGDVRNRLTAHYVLRQRPDEARYQTGLRAAQLPGDIRTLPDATGYLLTVKGDFVKVQIPQMTAGDVVRMGALLGGSTPSKAPTTQGFGFRPTQRPEGALEGAAEGARTHAPSSALESPEATRILALFTAGRSISQIVKELWGVEAGRQFQERANYITEVLRAALVHGGVR